MKLNTASQAISLAREMEEKITALYASLAGKYPQYSRQFLDFSKANKAGFARVERAYYGVISDAIEGCFAFDIDPDEYAFQDSIPTTADLAGAIKIVLSIEEKACRFYMLAAEQSKSLLADVPRAFLAMVKLKNEHRVALTTISG